MSQIPFNTSNYLKSLILNSGPVTFDLEFRLRRSFALFELLGNPQNKLKIIHIAGTSGKGSTAYYISRLLHAHGFKIGLHISPHLIDVRERFQIDNKLVDQKTYAMYLQKVRDASEKLKKTKFGAPSYFETLVALSLLLFYEKGVDYAVIETGMGGWHDATNTTHAQNKLCVLTRIGLDHTGFLGNTMAKVALHKAKIIQYRNRVISHWNTPQVRRVIEEVASQQNASLSYVRHGKELRNVQALKGRVCFDFAGYGVSLRRVQLDTPASYQAENAAFALSVLAILSKRDTFDINEKKIRDSLSQGAYPGRMESLKIGARQIVMDGAHNPQKMRSFLDSLAAAYPNARFHFLLAFKEGKNFKAMLRQIAPLAQGATTTNFTIDVQDSMHVSENPDHLKNVIRSLKQIPVRAENDPVKAFELALTKDEKSILVITGSLYLVACLYKHIYAHTDRK